MDTKFLKQAARAISGRLKSALAQLAREEAARAVRHFRERMQAPRPASVAGPAPLSTPASAPGSPAAEADPVHRSGPHPEPAPEAPAQPASAPAANKNSSAADALLDINAASREDLIALKGIGEARADAIVQGRPYARPAELVERRILPASVYEATRGRIRGG